MDKIVLSYNDSLLRESDLMLLQNGNWLNDNIIAFMFEYFQLELFKSCRVAFLDPNFVQLIKLSTREDATSILSTMDLASKDLVFVPVNDNMNSSNAGGTHWSLLVYESARKVFLHYDSFSRLNISAANNVCRNFLSTLKASKPSPCEMEVSKQANCYDCGVYVIKTAELVCRENQWNESWSEESLSPGAITEERNAIHKLILEKAGQT